MPIAPWFMNLVGLPARWQGWSDLVAGTKEVIAFPSGEYECIHNTREMTGGYKACSVFSPMGDFDTQAQAIEVAEAVVVALFDEQNLGETDRSAEIRIVRETEIAAARAAEEDAEPQVTTKPTRRQVISGGMAVKVEE